jgi:hypothetical protein
MEEDVLSQLTQRNHRALLLILIGRISNYERL